MIAELYRLRYLLAAEIFLLVVFGVFGFVTFAIMIAIVLLGITVYITYNSPIVSIHLLLFSILVDSLVPIKTYATTPSILIVEFFLVFILFLSIIRFLSTLDKKLEIPYLILLWLPFLAWAMLGLLISVDKLRVLTYWKNYFAGFFVFTLTYYVIKNKFHLKTLFVTIILWGVLLSLIEIKVLLELGGFTTGIIGLFLRKNLLTVGWGKSNYLAAFFVVIIPFSIGYLFYSKSKKTKTIIALALGLMTFAMILTLSRGGILALLIALVVLFSKILKKRTLVPFLIVLSAILLIVLLNPLTYVLIDRISSLETSSSLYSRINFYEDTWNAFLMYPITGVGLGNLSYYATFILSPAASPSAHNIVLGALGETGVIGTFFYFLILGTLLKKAFSSYKYEKEEALKVLKWSCFAALVGGLTHSLVEPTLDGLQFSIMFWTIAGITMRLDILKLLNKSTIIS